MIQEHRRNVRKTYYVRNQIKETDFTLMGIEQTETYDKSASQNKSSDMVA